MRTVRVVVPPKRLEEARQALAREEFSYVAIPLAERDGQLLEVPVPSNAVPDVLATLESADVDIDEYTVIGGSEAALTATSERLERRYVGTYEPLTSVELRSKARDLNSDTISYVALMILSAFVATAGLLLDSPAIVVGSMVIAPIIGPSLIASVGSVSGDRRMIVDGLWMQTYGVALAVVAAAVLAAGVRAAGIVPTLELSALDLFGVRLAPNMLSLVVGLGAGAAAGVGLTTKGPTAIIGVMIAAALIPAAAAVGIAVAWGEPELAIGTALLVVATLAVINLAVFVVLLVIGYRPTDRTAMAGDLDRSVALSAVLVAGLLVLGLVVGVGTAQQVTVDRHIQATVEDTVANHDDLAIVAVRTEYADLSPFTGPRAVTVVLTGTGDPPPEAVAAAIQEALVDRIDEPVTVRVQLLEYATAG